VFGVSAELTEEEAFHIIRTGKIPVAHRKAMIMQLKDRRDNCEWCGREYLKQRSDRVFCSESCKTQTYRDSNG